jgi:SAM-dependent methyltransferase
VSEFSSEWLDLREPVDARARSAEIANAVAARFALRDELRVLDLASGTGANLRAVAPLLPKRQTWKLVDRDPRLLDAAKSRLVAWADASESDDLTLTLEKDGREIVVSFAIADLARDTGDLIGEPWQLITASAFFDIASENYIRSLAKAVAERKAAFYAALTYNGLRRWTPHRPADNQMAAAFQRHQMRDKGLGIAAGPLAAAQLGDQFRLNGYTVLEDDSPWRLERGDRMLTEELVRSHAVAVSEVGGVDDKTIVSWVNVPRTGALIGHTDTFAVPGAE